MDRFLEKKLNSLGTAARLNFRYCCFGHWARDQIKYGKTPRHNGVEFLIVPSTNGMLSNRCLDLPAIDLRISPAVFKGQRMLHTAYFHLFGAAFPRLKASTILSPDFSDNLKVYFTFFSILL